MISRSRVRVSARYHCVVTFSSLHLHAYVPCSIIWYQPNGWGVNRHTMRCTSPVSVVSQCNVAREGNYFLLIMIVITCILFTVHIVWSWPSVISTDFLGACSHQSMRHWTSVNFMVCYAITQLLQNSSDKRLQMHQNMKMPNNLCPTPLPNFYLIPWYFLDLLWQPDFSLHGISQFTNNNSSMYLSNSEVLSPEIKEVHVGNSFISRLLIIIFNECISPAYSKCQRLVTE